DHFWGWAYGALDGDLERGKVIYEVVESGLSGVVEFVAACHFRGASSLGPVTSLGWWLFGCCTQLRFYRRCGERMRCLVERALRGEAVLAGPAVRAGSLVYVPSDARACRLDALAVHRVFPG
ncbi:DUF1990 family protein, partial [Streptomyces sp. CRPSP2-6A1]|uniref:DUF1990 family protein n=1 Tax=Streptomyces sp. CRPSP2-6A1 TaxID=2799588 RepID=UPI0018F06459